MNRTTQILLSVCAALLIAVAIVKAGGGGGTSNAPTNLSGTAPECCRIELKWTASAGTTASSKYEIWRGTGAGAGTNTFGFLGTANGGFTTNYSDSSPFPSTTYRFFLVHLLNGVTRSPNSAVINVTTPPCGNPTPPTGLTVTANSSSCHKANVSWSSVSCRANSFQLQRADNAAFTVGVVTYTGLTTSPYTVTGLSAPSVTYYFRIRAVGPGPTFSTYSSTFTYTTPSNCNTTP